MPDIVTPPPAVPGEPAPQPQPAPTPAPDNAAFARLRTEADTAKREMETLKAQLTELQRKDMDEKTRLQAELDDAKKATSELATLRDAHGKFTSNVEAECKAAIASLPQDKQQAIEKLTQYVPLDERLAAIREASAAFGVAPQSAGTRTQPGASPAPAPNAPEPPKPLAADQLGKLGWGEAVKANGPVTAMPDIPSLVAAEVQKALAAAGK